MAILSRDDDDVGEMMPLAGSEKSHDVARVLLDSGHRVAQLPNGVTLGVRLEGIPYSCGVHVDVVFVVDLRRARFGRGPFAMKTALWPIVTQRLDSLLEHVALSDVLKTRTILTQRGRISFDVLEHPDGRSTSFIHETRTIYVVTGDLRPTVDLSWLTRPSRVVTAEEFPLVRASDIRASRPVLEEVVDAEKWEDLESLIRSTWISIFLTGLAALLFLSYAVGLGSTSLLVHGPLIIAAAGLAVVVVWLQLRAGRLFRAFVETTEREIRALQRSDDVGIVERHFSEAGDALRILESLQIRVPPLLISAAEALRSHDCNVAVQLASAILDDCVTLSTFGVVSDDEFATADTGLGVFLGLFDVLVPHFDRAQLAHAYVALTSASLSEDIGEDEIAEHLGTLANALFDMGVLGPDAKEEVDDILNAWAMEYTAQRLSRELGEETPADDTDSEESISGSSLGTERDSVQTEEELAVLRMLGSDSPSESVAAANSVSSEPGREKNETRKREGG